MLRAFGRVATCCDMLGVVDSSLKMAKFEPTTPNMSQHTYGGQTHATCCAQQCCDMLCWHVAIVWPGLNLFNCLLTYFVFIVSFKFIVDPSIGANQVRSQYLFQIPLGTIN